MKKITRTQAGRRGGQSTYTRHGWKHMQEIGRRGGKAKKRRKP